MAHVEALLFYDEERGIAWDCVRGRPRRWVVERTNSWHNNFRSLRVRWERKSAHYLALVHFASALIATRAATRRNGQ